MNPKNLILFLILFSVGTVLGIIIGQNIGYKAAIDEASKISDFEECAEAGNPVMESYPRQCNAFGKTYTEILTPIPLDQSDLIEVDFPKSGDSVSSPLVIEGKARGNWYFEASFPVELRDGSGNLIAESFATAQGEWMTEDFVTFSAEVEFAKPDTQNGVLVLKKDNPSGLTQYDAEVQIPIRFF